MLIFVLAIGMENNALQMQVKIFFLIQFIQVNPR
jgi:hypothetical protein